MGAAFGLPPFFVMTHELDDVVSGISRRDESAFSVLYDLMADRLFGVALRSLRNRHDAEDAVQRAFLELVKSGFRPGDGRALAAWLYQSVRFSCLDEVRRRKRRPEQPTSDIPDQPQSEEPVEGFHPDLERALGELTPEQRMVLHLKLVEGLDGNEIAEIMGSSRAAVYAMAGRAETRIRSAMMGVESVSPPASPLREDHE